MWRRSSPHTRGAPSHPRPTRRYPGIIPAYAGSTIDEHGASPVRRDHPRIRGEHENLPAPGQPGVGSSPHTRGAHPVAVAVGVGPRIIPAYAGSTAETIQNPSNHRDHPRIRGEHFQVSFQFPLGAGSSPHTRGAHRDTNRAYADMGIIPAYAGSTCSSRLGVESCRDHPRIRGEHHVKRSRLRRIFGSSPHTRGAQPGVSNGELLQGIIPAYAGSTKAADAWVIAHEDHPRIRGEHDHSTDELLVRSGSSPHTRGAHARAVMPDRKLRIIPAYAGSTP